jgi:hypothetical protein
MIKYNELQDGFRIEYRLLETKEISENVKSEQLRFYTTPIYNTIEELEIKMNELNSLENFRDGVVILCKNFSKDK